MVDGHFPLTSRRNTFTRWNETDNELETAFRPTGADSFGAPCLSPSEVCAPLAVAELDQAWIANNSTVLVKAGKNI